MAADANRLAAALAYEDDRRRRLAESIPALTGPTTALRRNVRTDLENLSAGLGQGIVNQLEGVKGLITDPVGTAKGAYEAVRGIVRDPKVLAQALAETGRKAMSGPLGAGEMVGEMLGPMRGKPPMAEIDVYHGTPHVFDEFDASKIGTGEGAQAYGHGIYFAENPEVARGYKERLSGSNPNVFLFDGKEVSISGGLPEFKKFAQIAKSNGFSRESAVLAYNTLQEKGGDLTGASSELSWKDAPNPFDDEAANLLRSLDLKPEGGALYKADLPDEMVDRMLDWDKPLSEQSQAIKKAMGGRYESWKNSTGQDLYEALSEGLGGDKATSDWLRENNIPGIRYLDAGSRLQGGSGTRNFVVFPGEEKKVKILKRE
jgi:hypothetical protein